MPLTDTPTSATAVVLKTLQAFLASDRPPFPWAVAYSGGRDSGVLVWALAQVVDPGALVALHVDHGWRPAEERAAEARLVDAQGLLWGVPVRHFGPPESVVATEDAARRHRYRCFADFLADHPGSPVWLAHHADDQAETVLMRLLKGRSWQGLGAMAPRTGPFLRPFLGLRASLLAQVAEEQRLGYHQDSTNASLGPTRNYLRNRVFPVIERRFPGAVPALGAFADVWRRGAVDPGLDPRWVVVPGAAEVPAPVWDRWSPLERQVQLAAAGAAAGGSRALSRRFLETLAADGRTEGGQGAGWSWSRTSVVRWERVVQPSTKEYFIVVGSDGERTLDGSVWRWSRRPFPGATALPGDGVDSWVIRTPVDGMRYASEEGEWGREVRKSRFAAARGPVALVTQFGLVRGAFDTVTGAPVWVESAQGKLHNGQIFVTLTKRSEYERRRR